MTGMLAFGASDKHHFGETGGHEPNLKGSGEDDKKTWKQDAEMVGQIGNHNIKGWLHRVFLSVFTCFACWYVPTHMCAYGCGSQRLMASFFLSHSLCYILSQGLSHINSASLHNHTANPPGLVLPLPLTCLD